MSYKKPPTSLYDFCFLPLWSRVVILHICRITDPPVIWPMRSRVEKWPSQLFIPNHFVTLFRQKWYNHPSCEHGIWIKLFLHIYFYLHFIFIKISCWLHLLFEWFWSLVKLHTFRCPHNCLTNGNFESKIWSTVKNWERSENFHFRRG